MSHPAFVRPLTDEERLALLQGEEEARHLAERNRFRTVLLSAKGQTVQQIAALLDLSHATVRAALRRFRQGGPPALRERPRSGRPRTVPPEVCQQLCQALEATPLAHGGARTTWTLQDVLTLLLPQLALSLSAVWRLLRRLKRRLKRVAQRQRSPDPDYVAKRAQLLAARERAARDPEHWAHLDADEASLHRHPSLGWAWAEQKSAPPLAGAGTADETRTLFGAVDTWSGQVHFMAAKSGCTTHLLEFLEQLLAAYPGRRLSVALDNWGVHTSKEAQAFYRRHAERLEIVWLPTYAPWLMAQEKVWKWMRSFVTHRHPFDTIAQVMQHFWNWARDLELDPTRVLQRIHKFVPVL